MPIACNIPWMGCNYLVYVNLMIFLVENPGTNVLILPDFLSPQNARGCVKLLNKEKA